jgi:hypothetical protein
MAGKAGARIGQPGDGRGSPVPSALFVPAFAAAVLLAAIGGLALAFLLSDPRARAALADLPDHPWWLVDRGPAGSDAAMWAVGATAATALVAAATLFAARRLLERSPALPVLAAGLFLLTIAFECLRGAAAFLVATDRSITAALFFSRAVWCARFTGLLSLLLVALHALELPEQRPVVLVPVVLVASLAVAASVPVDRTTFLAQLVFRLGDEQGVWFVNLVIGALIPLSVLAAAVVRRERRLALLAGAFALLLAARELVFFGLRPVRLACGIACLVLGSALLLDAIRRGYVATREGNGRPAGTESSVR